MKEFLYWHYKPGCCANIPQIPWIDGDDITCSCNSLCIDLPIRIHKKEYIAKHCGFISGLSRAKPTRRLSTYRYKIDNDEKVLQNINEKHAPPSLLKLAFIACNRHYKIEVPEIYKSDIEFQIQEQDKELYTIRDIMGVCGNCVIIPKNVFNYTIVYSKELDFCLKCNRFGEYVIKLLIKN